MARVGLKDVAARLGVSHVSVWNAFNRPTELSDARRLEILRVAAEMGYRGPQAAGRALRTGRADAVGLYSPDPLAYLFEDPAAAEFMAGLAEVLQSRQVALLVLPAAEGSARPNAAETAAVDGLVLYSVPRDDATARRLLARGLPTVLVDTHLPGAGTTWIGVDDRAGARAAAAHVLGLGHRAVAVLALEPSAGYPSGPVAPEVLARGAFDVTRARWLGYRDALSAAGVRPVAVSAVLGNTELVAEREAGAMLDGPSPRPTAILCMSDRLALGAARAAAARGLRVPDDLALVGFDDIAAAAHAPAGGLTTVRQPMRRKGTLTARALFAEGEGGGEGDGGGERIVLPTELVVRGSTGAPGR